MKDKGKKILEAFDSKIGLLSNLKISSEQLLRSLLKMKGILPHQITSRIKERRSLENKILRKNDKYNSLEEITDLVGLRVITYFEDEIDLIAQVVNDEFEIDPENSVDKRLIESDKFGYRSLHFVVSFKSERLGLPEYSSFNDLKFEIQIRSILQHSWAEIEHDIGYKGEFEIPDTAKRTFYRVAALLEQADIEFVKLKNELKEYEKNVIQEIKEAPSTVRINKASLTSYIKNSTELSELEAKLANSKEGLMVIPIDDHNYISNKEINILKSNNVNSIDEIDEIIKKHSEEFLLSEIKRMKNDDSIRGFVQGATLGWILEKYYH